jgi:phosphopentomutase
MIKKRIFLIMLDSFGIGEAKDAKDFGDEGSSTLKSIMKSDKFNIPNMKKLGLLNIDGLGIKGSKEAIIGAYGKLSEESKGKDTTTGHWEISGIISKNPMPTYPDGFPKEIIDEFERLTGRGVLCNKPYSGTEVIKDYGDEHVATGKLIVYTSADSVFQIAAHEDLVPVEELYRYCEMARKLLKGEHAVGRVIARPFIGSNGNYERTANRHDFSLEPTSDTVLDILHRNGLETYAVGKIYDIFAGRGISNFVRTKSNAEGMQRTLEALDMDFNGLCFVNLVDCDMIYGHRRDIDGYAEAISEFDKFLSTFIPKMKEDDILMISADHGCDPGFKGSDHTREYVPLLAYGKSVKQGVDLGIRESFADVAKTILDIYDLDNNVCGVSFKKELLV